MFTIKSNVRVYHQWLESIGLSKQTLMVESCFDQSWKLINTNCLFIDQTLFCRLQNVPHLRQYTFANASSSLQNTFQTLKNLQFLLRIFFMTSVKLKCLPRSSNLSLWNRKKSYRAISDEYGAWSILFVGFLAKNSYTKIDPCEGCLLYTSRCV